MKEIFENIYKNGTWLNKRGGTAGGPGSCIECSGEYLKFLEGFCIEHNIKSIIDLGCGDFNLMQHFNLTQLNYTGVDIVPFLIEDNNKEFSSETVRFVEADILSYTPESPCDLVIIKDVLQHLCYTDVIACVTNIKYSKHILLINDYSTRLNKDCETGGYRPLNLHIPPYSNHIKDINPIFKFDSCGFYKNVDMLSF